MSEQIFKPVILSQLEDALEERQNSDRRKQQKAVPPTGVAEDRRKGSRRTESDSDSE